MSGIDYGRGMTNLDHDTNIRYGVISVNDIVQAWSDSSVPVYPPARQCPRCEGTGDWGDDPDDDCPTCYGMAEQSSDDPTEFVYVKEGYKATQSFESPYVFVVKSPYFTTCRFCSPCMPGAGDLNSHDPEGVRTYCLGHDWFDGGVAPYPIYEVGTGNPVPPPTQ